MPIDPIALAPLDARRSVPSRQLTGPGPDHATLLRMLRSALRVPDHGKRQPWRFLRSATCWSGARASAILPQARR